MFKVISTEHRATGYSPAVLPSAHQGTAHTQGSQLTISSCCVVCIWLSHFASPPSENNHLATIAVGFTIVTIMARSWSFSCTCWEQVESLSAQAPILPPFVEELFAISILGLCSGLRKAHPTPTKHSGHAMIDTKLYHTLGKNVRPLRKAAT